MNSVKKFVFRVFVFLWRTHIWICLFCFFMHILNLNLKLLTPYKATQFISIYFPTDGSTLSLGAWDIFSRAKYQLAAVFKVQGKVQRKISVGCCACLWESNERSFVLADRGGRQKAVEEEEASSKSLQLGLHASALRLCSICVLPQSLYLASLCFFFLPWQTFSALLWPLCQSGCRCMLEFSI